MNSIKLYFFILLLITSSIKTYSSDFLHQKNNYTINYRTLPVAHYDSIHKINFRYADKKRGLKPYIAPALLISAGTVLHFMPDTKEQFKNFAQEHFTYQGKIDDYAYYAPLATVYSLQALGIKGKNNFGNVTAIAIKSFVLNAIITTGLKYGVNEERPNGGIHSFPSGHTSKAFTLAHILHKEYEEKSVWYSIGGYACATSVGIMRIGKNAHWVSDIFAGAGIGILSTELIYLTHLYKWDNEHMRRLDIFPFQTKYQKGLTLVYTF